MLFNNTRFSKWTSALYKSVFVNEDYDFHNFISGIIRRASADDNLRISADDQDRIISTSDY